MTIAIWKLFIAGAGLFMAGGVLGFITLAFIVGSRSDEAGRGMEETND